MLKVAVVLGILNGINGIIRDFEFPCQGGEGGMAFKVESPARF